MTTLEQAIETEFYGGLPTTDCPTLIIDGEDTLASWFDVTDLAVHAMGIAGKALSSLISAKTGVATKTGSKPQVHIDQRRVALWFDMTLRPIGWELPSPWDAIAGDYETKDGWIKLHTNAPHHRRAVEGVLEADQRDSVMAAVRQWCSAELETAIIEAGGCAAEMRDIDAWKKHPQGAAVALEPLVDWKLHNCRSVKAAPYTANRPLSGVRVLDLTRVLAGPVATRFLAVFGADVLRIDPPTWSEPGVVPEVTLGKRCAGLDLRDASDRDIFTKLLSEADILVHGYRPGALAGLGFGEGERRAINPHLIDVSLCAYGWTGPWAERRGFDSLVQMSSGIAAYGMEKEGAAKPTPLPVQALDHATGYFMAAAALVGLKKRYTDNKAITARLSLARTAAILIDRKRQVKSDVLPEETTRDVSSELEKTGWGDAKRIKFPLSIEGVTHGFDYPAGELRSAAPSWHRTEG